MRHFIGIIGMLFFLLVCLVGSLFSSEPEWNPEPPTRPHTVEWTGVDTTVLESTEGDTIFLIVKFRKK